MDRFIKKTREFIFAEQGGIFSSAIILSTMIVVSRIFGFLRYRILAGYFSKEELDIFFASFRIPDLVFEILITGALTSSFIPVFIKYQKNRDELSINISSILNLLSAAMTVFIVALLFCLDFLIPLVTPGFKGEKLVLVIQFSKILLIGQLPFLVFGNFLTGIAQAKKTFLITAVAPVFYNIAVIVGTAAFSTSLGLYAPIWGVVVGAVLFLVIQLPILSIAQFSYRIVIQKTEGVREFFRMIGPRILTVVITQIDATIDLSITSLLGPGAYTVFYLAQRLQLLPVSVVGIAFGQASLPYLSDLFDQNKIEELKKIIIDSLLNLIYLTIPFMVYFIFARTPLVRVFYGGEKFDWDATVQTAFTLSYFSLSLPFHSIYYFLTRCFYALMDSKTPFVISLVSVILNTVLSLLFALVFHFPVWSLAISFSVSVIINSTVLFILLEKRLAGFNIRYFFAEIAKMFAIAVIAAPVPYYLMKLFDKLIFDTTRALNVFILLGLSSLLYFLLYLILSWFANIHALFDLIALLTKGRHFQKKITEIPSYE